MTCGNCEIEFKAKRRKNCKLNFCCLDCAKQYKIKNNKILLDCNGCGKSFLRVKSQYKENKLNYCSNECRPNVVGLEKHKCKTCGSEVERYHSEVVKSGNVFCNNSCSAKHSNATRILKDTGRSKLEKWIQNDLIIKYPELEILYNDKTAIKMELDIFIPSLKLAFEINGIFHYKDVFNNGNLDRQKVIDEEKKTRCNSNLIKLIEIDSQEQRNFKVDTSIKYIILIKEHIDKNLTLSSK